MKQEEIKKVIEELQTKLDSMSEEDRAGVVKELESILEEYETGLKEIEDEVKYSTE